MGIGGSVLFLLTQTNRSQSILVDGSRSKLFNVVSGVPHTSVLGSLFIIVPPVHLGACFHTGEFSHWLFRLMLITVVSL